MRAAHNVTDRPVLIDGDGRTLGGGEWAAIDETAEAKAAVARGELAFVDAPDDLDNLEPAALAAFEAAATPQRPARPGKER